MKTNDIVDDIAGKILDQLGHKATVMLGALDFVSLTYNGLPALQFRIRGCREVSHIIIGYDMGQDTYLMHFLKFRKLEFKTVREVPATVATMHRVIEDVTSLRTSL